MTHKIRKIWDNNIDVTDKVDKVTLDTKYTREDQKIQNITYFKKTQTIEVEVTNSIPYIVPGGGGGIGG